MSKKSFILLTVLMTIATLLHAQLYDDYSSNDGVGLYFNNVIPKNAVVTQVLKTELSETFKYAEFYEDIYTHKLYLHDNTDILSLDDIFKKQQPVQANNNTTYTVMDIPSSQANQFINQNNTLPLTLEIPQHHGFSPRLQAIRPKRPHFQLNAVLEAMNSLGLEKSIEVKTKGGGFNMIYDRLFINDEDEKKMLVIWLNNNRVYANFLSNEGKWQFAEPKIIHNDIVCTENNGTTLRRELDGTSDKATLITELNCIKSGDSYYVGYSISTWEASQCFVKNIASCHLSILDSKLQITKSVQIPDNFSSLSKDIFATDFQMKIHKNNDTICAIIQSPNVGTDKLFIQCFDKKLKPIRNMMYLSNTSNTYEDLIPVVPTSKGNFICYKESRKNSYELVTQFIGNNGTATLPVRLFSIDKNDNKIISSVYMQKDKNDNLYYYFILYDLTTKKTELQSYKYSVSQFWNDLQYSITTDNWKSDKDIMTVDKICKATNDNISNHVDTEYKRAVNDEYTKYAYVDNSLSITKYSIKINRDRLQKSSKFSIDIFYDEHNVMRKAEILLNGYFEGEQLYDTILVYYNSDGNKIWEMRTNHEGKVFTSKKEVNSNKYLRKIKFDNPFEDFHKTN